MVIGIDAGTLSVKDERLKVGVYNVVNNLIKELGILDTKNEYILYSFEELEPYFLEGLPPNVENIVLKPKQGWFLWRLPLSLAVHPVDLFLGTGQAVPFGVSKSIGFIYDLGFLTHPELYLNTATKLKSRTDSLVRRSQKIITISKTTKKHIIEHYDFPEENIIVSYPGVNLFLQSVPVFISKDPYFLHVGSLKPGKNIPFLIKIFADFIKKSKRKFLLLLIGSDFWLDTDIIKTIEELHMGEYVRLLGHVPNEVLGQYYKGAQAFVTTSKTEGFCLPVAEAMFCGCPVIAPSHGVFLEIAAEKSLLVQTHASAEYVQLMKTITEDKNARDIAVAKGIAHASQYTWKSFAKTVHETIMQC